VGTVTGTASDPVGTVTGTASDPVGTVTGTASDPVGTAGDAVSGTADPLATSVGLVDQGQPASSDTVTSDGSTGRSTRAGATFEGSGSTTAMQRDARAPSGDDTVDLMATADVARPDVQSETSCAVGAGFMCSLMNEVMGLGSLVDAVTAVIRSLALTGLTLLPWLAVTLALATIGLSALRLTRGRSTRVASMIADADSWAYPEVVR
jgi:hypothetical protein